MKEDDADPANDTQRSRCSIGIARLQTKQLFTRESPLELASGERLGPIDVAYETYGTLNEARDNAVFVCHALTGDAHAAGKNSSDDRKPGWWDAFVGPGRSIDTDRYFVICANVLGGCQGTTGPSSIDTSTGQPYCLTFPFVTVADVVDVHAALVRELGIEQLRSVVGGSLGGMQVLDWATRHPDMVKSAVVLASAAKLSAQGIAFNAAGRRAIVVDPHFHDGRYREHGEDVMPKFGLGLARMIAHITYLSVESIEHKFGRRLQDAEEFAFALERETEFQIESYLHYQGKRFVERFDANSYLYLTRAMDYFDLAGHYGSLKDAFAHSRAQFLIVSYNSDWLFPTSQSRELAHALVEADRHVSIVEFDSRFGHDAFLIEHEQLARIVRPFLENVR